MQLRDFLHLTGSSLIAHRLRSFLTALGIAVGIAAVVLLTSIGEGVHRFCDLVEQGLHKKYDTPDRHQRRPVHVDLYLRDHGKP